MAFKTYSFNSCIVINFFFKGIVIKLLTQKMLIFCSSLWGALGQCSSATLMRYLRDSIAN